MKTLRVVGNSFFQILQNACVPQNNFIVFINYLLKYARLNMAVCAHIQNKREFIMAILAQKKPLLIGLMSLIASSIIQAETLSAPIQSDKGEFMGYVNFYDFGTDSNNQGLLIQVKLKGLDPDSLHGFHIHEVGNCSPMLMDSEGSSSQSMPAQHTMGAQPSIGAQQPTTNPTPATTPTASGAFMNAGGHFDPEKTGKHKGPYSNGHKGDLPVLGSDYNGKAYYYMFRPHLSTHQIKGHAIMIHKNGDNYTDNPANGGGGDRVGCGVIYDSQQMQHMNKNKSW